MVKRPSGLRSIFITAHHGACTVSVQVLDSCPWGSMTGPRGGHGMTRETAQQIVARIRRDEIQIDYSRHARQEMAVHGLSANDVRAIIQCHEMRGAPEFVEEHKNHKVELWGKSLEDGRPIGLIFGLREKGPCVLVTVMPVEKKNQSLARRKHR